jgi:NADH dehydrogenase
LNKEKHHIIIIGGGFGGIEAAKMFRGTSINVTLIDKRNFHLFQPLLYQVATGGLSPADISSPLRSIFGRYKNINVRQSEVTDIDIQSKSVATEQENLKYDSLIIAPGSTHHYFGNESWQIHAPGLKTIEDATSIRSRILQAFERAELESNLEKQQELLTFVIVGAGPTGIEMAGAIGELACHTLKNDFRNIKTENARILLIESSERILLNFPPLLSRKAEMSLKKLNVDILKSTIVTAAGQNGVAVKTKEEIRHINSWTVIWAAGVKAPPLVSNLINKTGAKADRQGRVMVDKFCQIPHIPDLYIIGDSAHFINEQGNQLPGIAPVAMQQGRFVADFIKKKLKNRSSRSFKYRDKGNLAVIGRKAAVAHIGKFQFGGYFAWLLWLFIHLMYIVGFENRVLVFIQWAYNYFTRNRSARLIANYKFPDNAVT